MILGLYFGYGLGMAFGVELESWLGAYQALETGRPAAFA